MKRVRSFPAFHCLLFGVIVIPGLHCKTEKATPLLFADPEHMAVQKQRYQSKDPEVLSLVARLTTSADTLLHKGPFSVMDKTHTPPGGDKHDYMSQGPYWWPDTTKPDGLPYIRRDGEVNPERAGITDAAYLSQLMNISETLSRAYYFTGDEGYARRCAQLLQVWFLDEATRMNPHLEYGQAIPGITEGRGIGIIETRFLGKVIDAVTLIRSSSSWNDKLEQGMQAWMRDYLNWLLHSEKGRDESVHPNNHGTWYDVQACALALYTGQDSIARDILKKAKSTRLDEHIMADGSQPRELARTLSFNYSSMNLLGIFYLAEMGERLDLDLWQYRNKQGATLQDALDFLLPAAMGTTEWTHEQIKPIQPESLIPHLIMASRVYDKAYAGKAAELQQRYEPESDYALFFEF